MQPRPAARAALVHSEEAVAEVAVDAASSRAAMPAAPNKSISRWN
jgi:hypothetical protein